MTDASKLEIIVTMDSSDVAEKASALAGVFEGLGSAVTAGLAVALAGLTALAGALGVAFHEGMQAQQVEAQLNAVLQSTGGIAGMTAEAVKGLADQFSQTTQYTDDAVLSAENMLLTFTNIGQNVFPQATQTVLDMSTALGQDLKNSSIQLGKALQDPIEGITALRRVGVNFTDAQKEMIEAMVEAGRVEEAQTFILRELQTEFGGSAEAAGKTLGGQLTILKNAFTNLAETVGQRLIDGVGPALIDIMQKVGAVVNDVIDILGGPEMSRVVGQVQDLLSTLTGGFDPSGITGGLREIINSASDAIAFIQQLIDEISGISSGEIMAGATESINRNNAMLQQSLDQLAAHHQQTLESLNANMQALTEGLNTQLSDLTAKYADRFADLNDRLTEARQQAGEQMAQAQADLNQKIEDNQRQLQDKLADMADQHADRRASLEGQLADKNADLAQSTADLKERLEEQVSDTQDKYAEKREALQEQLAKATTDTERAAIAEKIAANDAAEAKEIAKLQAKEAKEEERLKAKNEREIAAINEKIAKEDAAYAKAVEKEKRQADERQARMKEDYDKQVAQLGEKLAKEEAAIEKQRAKLEAERNKEEQQIRQKFANEVAALQTKIAQENEAYARQAAELQQKANEQNQQIIERANARAEAIGKGPAHELAVMVDNAHELEAAFLTIKTVTDDVFAAIAQSLGMVNTEMESTGITWQDVAKVVSAAIILLGAIFTGVVDGIIVAAGVMQTGLDLLFKGVAVIIYGLQEVIQGFADFFSGIVSGDWAKAWDGFLSIIRGAMEIVAGLFVVMGGLFETALGAIVGFVAGAVKGVIDYFKHLYDELVGHSIIPDLVRDMKKILLGTDWAKVGKDIVDGLIKGVAGMAGAFVKSITDLADKAIKSVKDRLRSHSPSEETADIGKDFVGGWILGIDRNTEALLHSMRGLAAQATLSVRQEIATTGNLSNGAVNTVNRSSTQLNNYGPVQVYPQTADQSLAATLTKLNTMAGKA